MNELALFAGSGGGILGGRLAGWRTICAVERDAYSAQVLAQRQNDGCLNAFPIWSDVCSFDGRPWRGVVDIVSGGFPCQDISIAGKGAGLSGSRSGLWFEMARVIKEVQPRFVLIENSPMLIKRGMSVILGNLAEMGFDAEWGVISAADVGAPHLRKRIWILATHPCSFRRYNRGDHRQRRQVLHNENRNAEEDQQEWQRRERGLRQTGSDVANTSAWRPQSSNQFKNPERNRRWWSVEPELGRVANGVAYRVERLRAIGNGQVPSVAELAWKVLRTI